MSASDVAIVSAGIPGWMGAASQAARCASTWAKFSPTCRRPLGEALDLQVLPVVSQEKRRRNVESFAEFLDLGSVEIAFLVQDFGNGAFGAKDRDQVFLTQVIGIHQRAKDLHRRSVRNGMMLFFVGVD